MMPSASVNVPTERRRDRTNEALNALVRLLDAARQRSGLEALAVAEAGGLLLAGAGPAALCDEIAAWAPLAGRLAANDSVPSRLDVFERRGVVQRLAVDGVELIVCGVGDGDGARRELGAVAEGCTRILGAGRSDAER